jgi:hypothetical protein
MLEVTTHRTCKVPRPAVPRSRRLGAGIGLLIGCAIGPLARVAAAAEGATCAPAYERAQELRRRGGLVGARAQLLVCTQADCPAFIVADCRRWLDEVEAAMPTVVLAAQSSGRDLEAVKVSVDGRVLTTHLEGRAIPVDPGKHRFSFTAAGRRETQVDVIINEGIKHRLIMAELGQPLAEPTPAIELAAPPAQPARPMRPLARGLFVASAIGLAGFAGFGLWGLSQEHSLNDECAPGCSPARVDTVRRRYLAADVSLAIGAIALGLGAYLHGNSVDRGGPARVGLEVAEGGQGATLSFGERF